jgi:hypothetical protein
MGTFSTSTIITDDDYLNGLIWADVTETQKNANDACGSQTREHIVRPVSQREPAYTSTDRNGHSVRCVQNGSTSRQSPLMNTLEKIK